MDAGFHLLRQEFGDAADQIEKKLMDNAFRAFEAMSADEQQNLLGKFENIPRKVCRYLAKMEVELIMGLLTDSEKESFTDLARGSWKTRYGMDTAVKEYPYLALAIVVGNGVLDRIEARATELESKALKLRRVRARL